MLKQLSVKVPGSTIALIDTNLKTSGFDSRAQWIRDAIERKLKEDELTDKLAVMESKIHEAFERQAALIQVTGSGLKTALEAEIRSLVQEE